MNQLLIVKEIINFEPGQEAGTDRDETGDSEYSDTVGFTCITCTAHQY